MNAAQRPTRPERLTRQEAKARTRVRLLEAAASEFAEKGYAGASVSDIADAAGYTIGALYSNFAGKEELFLELLSSRSAGRMAEALAILADTDVPIASRGRTLAQHLVDVADIDAEQAVLETEFWLHATRNPEFRERLAAQVSARRDALEGVLAAWARNQHLSPDLPFAEVATVLLALFRGLVELRRTGIDLVPDDLYSDAIHWLFTGLAAEYPAAD